MPRNPKHALQLDEEHGNDNWQRSIKKELDEINEYETFRLPKEGESLNGFQHIPYHLVFDVKFDGRHKSRLVAGGNHTEPLKEDIYSGVVSIESIRILFFLATLNNLQIWAAYVVNAFLNARCRERVLIRTGPEFGPKYHGKDLDGFWVPSQY